MIEEDKKHIVDVADELHRCRGLGHKSGARDINEDGIHGLKDKERSGRHPDIPEDVMIKMRQDLRSQ